MRQQQTLFAQIKRSSVSMTGKHFFKQSDNVMRIKSCRQVQSHIQFDVLD